MEEREYLERIQQARLRQRQRQAYVRKCRIGLVIGAVVVLVGILLYFSKGGTMGNTGVSEACEAYRPLVKSIAGDYNMSDYEDLIMAVMMQESGGRSSDVMQAAEGAFNTRYPKKPNGITDPEYSIRCGIQELKYALEKVGCQSPGDMEKIEMALQAYNFGADGYLAFLEKRGEKNWSQETADAYAKKASKGKERDEKKAKRMGKWKYGDQMYPEHVLRYYGGRP